MIPSPVWAGLLVLVNLAALVGARVLVPGPRRWMVSALALFGLSLVIVFLRPEGAWEGLSYIAWASWFTLLLFGNDKEDAQGARLSTHPRVMALLAAAARRYPPPPDADPPALEVDEDGDLVLVLWLERGGDLTRDDAFRFRVDPEDFDDPSACLDLIAQGLEEDDDEDEPAEASS